ncbi:MAG: hypothetical protein ACXAB5_07050 [Candidatus Thorarchaeota archaeon]
MSEEVKQVVVLDRDSKLSPRVALLYSMMVKTRENLLDHEAMHIGQISFLKRLRK